MPRIDLQSVFLSQPGYAAPIDYQGIGRGVQLLFNPVLGGQDQVTGRIWTPGGNVGVDTSQYGKAFRFDGVDDHYSYTGYPEITGAAGTLFLWYPVVGAPDNFGSVFFGSSGTYFWIDNSNRVYAWATIANGTYSGWFNTVNRSIIFSSNGTPAGTKLYIDGSELTTVTWSGALTGFAAGNKALRFGAYPTNNAYDVNGQILIGAYFNRKIEDAEARLLHDTKGLALFKAPTRKIWIAPAGGSTNHDLTIASAVQTNSAQAAGITQTHPLAVQPAAQANAPASGAITLVHPLTASPASQTNTVQTGGISQGSAFNVAPVAQGNVAGTGGITQSHVLTGGAAVQGNTAGTGAVALVHELAADNPIQQNSASVAGLAPSSDINLSVPALTQANLADDVPVHQVHTLVTSASVQTSTTSAVSLTQVHTLTSEQLAQGNVASTIAVNVSGQLVALGLTQNNAFSAKQISMVQTLTIADFAQDNRMSGGAISPGAIFEQAVAAGTAIEPRIKKPGIPAETPAWLRTMLEIVTGRRNNKITIPESKVLNFSAIPTKEECEALYQYTHSVRNATEEIIKRLDS